MIKITQGRQQPYAVWYRGKIEKFCDNYAEAVELNERLNPGEGGERRGRKA